MKDWLKLFRVTHWLKNGLVLLPLFFSKNFLNVPLLVNSGLAFIDFCFISSLIYVINDIVDVEKDRQHEIKKNRPLAAGRIQISSAKYSIVVLSLTVLFLTYFLWKNNNNNLWIPVIPMLYLLLNIAYSKVLKNFAILDVVILASGFFLRTFYGGVVINIEISHWLYFMIVFGAFYLGFGKRRNEIIKSGQDSRKVLRSYSKNFLDKNMYVCLSLAIMFYSLWCIDDITVARIGNNYLIYTAPLIAIILFTYSLDIERDSHGDPVDVILSDRVIQILIGAYVILLFVIFYII